MPRFKVFDVYIECGGKKLEEYDVRVDEDRKTVTCWVESKAGQVGSRFLHHNYTIACLNRVRPLLE